MQHVIITPKIQFPEFISLNGNTRFYFKIYCSQSVIGKDTQIRGSDKLDYLTSITIKR